MADGMVRTMRLVGSAMALGVAATAVAWYFVLWPFDKGSLAARNPKQ